jgi:hypothetical protein
MAITAGAGGYALSALKVACDGRAAQSQALAGLIGAPGRAIQVQYDYAGGSSMWVATSAAILDGVEVDQDWLMLTLRLAGPTRFENTQGRACVDGSSGARC